MHDWRKVKLVMPNGKFRSWILWEMIAALIQRLVQNAMQKMAVISFAIVEHSFNKKMAGHQVCLLTHRAAGKVFLQSDLRFASEFAMTKHAMIRKLRTSSKRNWQHCAFKLLLLWIYAYLQTQELEFTPGLSTPFLLQESSCAYVILVMALYWVIEALPLAITAFYSHHSLPHDGNYGGRGREPSLYARHELAPHWRVDDQHRNWGDESTQADRATDSPHIWS